MKEKIIPTMELMREEVLYPNPLKEHRQCEVTMLREDTNKNGKRNLETLVAGKKARKISKKKAKLEKLREVPEKNSQEIDLQNLNLAGIIEPRRMGLCQKESI
jgi:hypothetical protein